jgi:hypothetical protein
MEDATDHELSASSRMVLILQRAAAFLGSEPVAGTHEPDCSLPL